MAIQNQVILIYTGHLWPDMMPQNSRSAIPLTHNSFPFFNQRDQGHIHLISPLGQRITCFKEDILQEQNKPLWQPVLLLKSQGKKL